MEGLKGVYTKALIETQHWLMMEELNTSKINSESAPDQDWFEPMVVDQVFENSQSDHQSELDYNDYHDPWDMDDLNLEDKLT